MLSVFGTNDDDVIMVVDDDVGGCGDMVVGTMWMELVVDNVGEAKGVVEDGGCCRSEPVGEASSEGGRG